MKVLKVIHGYPPRYSAGSEVYSQILARELANNHEVQVFARQENNFIPDYAYATELDVTDPRILVHLVNIPRSKYSDTCVHLEVDKVFKQVLDSFKPDIVHFGHLSHLSLNLPTITANYGIPSIFTLHDFWLICPRGTFLQRNSKEPWALCDKQEDQKCATQCYKGKFFGTDETAEQDLEYWVSWSLERKERVKKALEACDIFIAPSKFLLNKFLNEFKSLENKILYLDYGFDIKRLQNREKPKTNDFTFGYIGTHTPQKGIHYLIKAFAQLKGDARLKIWGYPSEYTSSLKSLVQKLPGFVHDRIEWLDGYKNANIVKEVFNNVDAIVVPSIWEENSPLVIHEAQQVRVPVITADIGGMSEYVHHNINGLLFKHRDINDLAAKMQLFINDSKLAITLGQTGYLYSVDGNIPNIKEHAYRIEKIYNKLLESKNKTLYNKPGPWRITFDTNPDHCNYKCIMCECFSPYSDVNKSRVSKGIARKTMNIQTIVKVLEEAKGSPLREIIPSTMGEPLLYKDFDRIISLCKEYNLKMNLTTNGSFPIKGVEKWGELLVPILSDIKISWNGASKKTHEQIMIGSNWEKSFDNLKKFLSIRDNYAKQNHHRCTVTLQLTFLETNFEELPALLELAINLGIDRLKGHHLWAHFEEIKNLSMRRNLNSIKKWNNIVRELKEIASTKPLPNGKKIILENLDLLSEHATEDLAPGGSCPFLGKEAWINTEGVFSPCCAPDELRKGLGAFGNVMTGNLQDIWQSKNYKDLQKNYTQNKLCIGCNMRKPLINAENSL